MLKTLVFSSLKSCKNESKKSYKKIKKAFSVKFGTILALFLMYLSTKRKVMSGVKNKCKMFCFFQINHFTLGRNSDFVFIIYPFSPKR
jgi:hypothetical protein